jgi:WD40 repeat protein
VPAPRRAAAPAPAAKTPPTITRIPAAHARKAGASVTRASFTDKGGSIVVLRDEGVDLVDVATGAGIAIQHAGAVGHALSADESMLVVSGGGQTSLWDARAAALKHVLPEDASNLVVSADGTRLALAGESRIAMYDATSGKELWHQASDINPFGLAFADKAKELVVTGNNAAVQVRSLDAGALLPGGGSADTGGTFGIALSPDGRFAAASAPAGHGLQVFEVHAWGPRTLVVVPEGACKEHVSLEFSNDGRHLYGWGGRRWVKGFDVGSWRPYASWHAPPGREVAAAAGDLSRVLSMKEDGSDPLIVNVSTSSETKLERPLSGSTAYVLSADGQRLVGWSEAKAIRVWAAKTGKVEYEEQP